jgi:DinB superfamily
MSTATKTAISKNVDEKLLARITEEGYGPGAWHGPDLKAALADVSAELAFWRPASSRHNIAEIALHHAYCTRSVRGQLSGEALKPFILEGDDWFELNEKGRLSWSQVQKTLTEELQHLTSAIAKNGTSRNTKVSDTERFDLVLGITCHAIYHAGQIQLIKRLHAGQ